MPHTAPTLTALALSALMAASGGAQPAVRAPDARHTFTSAVRIVGPSVTSETLKRVHEADRDMRTLAEETGALSFLPEARQLRDVYARIATDLATQYSLGYEPARGSEPTRAVDGHLHSVHVEIVNRPELQARTRAG